VSAHEFTRDHPARRGLEETGEVGQNPFPELSSTFDGDALTSDEVLPDDPHPILLARIEHPEVGERRIVVLADRPGHEADTFRLHLVQQVAHRGPVRRGRDVGGSLFGKPGVDGLLDLAQLLEGSPALGLGIHEGPAGDPQ
jgi:hypothetical protein